MDDLDNLLDDIDIDETLAGGADDAQIKAMKTQVPGLSDEVAGRWCGYVNISEGVEMASKFKYSHLYSCWDDIKNQQKSPAAHKLLQDAVRSACVKCGFNEKRMVKILVMTNPMESESGKALQDSYNRQILNDMRRSILTTPDYDAAQFPSLAAMYRKNEE